MTDVRNRIIIKRGDGPPTVPASADHRDLSWLATDIYEGEFYQDNLTGYVYGRNGNLITPMFAGTPPTGTINQLVFADSPFAAGRYETMLVNASGGVIEINLPPAALGTTIFIIKKIDPSETVVNINADGLETIEGVSTYSLTVPDVAITIRSNTLRWLILDSHLPTNSTYTSAAVFPTVGMEHIIFIALDTGEAHYWNGTSYVSLSGTYISVPVLSTVALANFNSNVPTNVPDLTYAITEDGDYVVYSVINGNHDENEEIDMYIAVNGVTDLDQRITDRWQKNNDQSVQGTFAIDGLVVGDIVTIQLNTRADDVDLQNRRMLLQSWR